MGEPIELGHDFFQDIIRYPVPLDMDRQFGADPAKASDKRTVQKLSV